VSAAAEGLAPAKPKESARRLSIFLQRIVLTLAFLLLWQLAASSVPGYLFPGPLATWDAFLRIVKDGSIALHLGVTMYRVTVGFFIATVVGVPLGILLGSSKRLGEFFSPVLPVMNSVSSAIWSLIAVVWFGLSDMTPIFVCLMTGLPLIVTNVWQGTQNVNAEWLELARSVRMPKYKIFWKIYLPAILPCFF
jgi:NitT/TauT family transport system permease protein